MFDIPLRRLTGEPDSLQRWSGGVLLAVNVASMCGNTPQYAILQELYEGYRGQGLTILGFPCNQFGAEEPGTSDEIAEFCRVNYGVTFPMFEKIEVNGAGRHPLYEILTEQPDDEGVAGDVRSNFEKFLIARDGTVVRRFRPKEQPNDPKVIAAIEQALAADA
jgi:glutathione peroxidase